MICMQPNLSPSPRLLESFWMLAAIDPHISVQAQMRAISPNRMYNECFVIGKKSKARKESTSCNMRATATNPSDVLSPVPRASFLSLPSHRPGLAGCLH